MTLRVLTEKIDPVSDRPVYKQIADHLRNSVTRGQLREGDRIPSEAQLMRHYGVARMTIRNALRVLESEGLLVAEHGRGVYVRTRHPAATDGPYHVNCILYGTLQHACQRQEGPLPGPCRSETICAYLTSPAGGSH